VLPVIVFVAVAIPVLVIAFAVIRKRTATGEVPEPGDTEQEYEDEFKQSEKLQEQWRKEHQGEIDEDKFY
jgi:hypothetical protein